MSLFLKTSTLLFLSPSVHPLFVLFTPLPTLPYISVFLHSLCLHQYALLHTKLHQPHNNGHQKKEVNGKAAPTKSNLLKPKPTPPKPAKSGKFKIVKTPIPTKAPKTSKSKPTAAEILLSKIKPTAAAKSKTTPAPAKNGNSKTAAEKKANGAAKANGNGKAAVSKPTAQAKVNGNGKSSAEKKVNAKVTAAPKVNGNGKVTTEKKVNGNSKVNGKAENKVNGEAKASGKAAANQAKTETTTKAKTEKVKAETNKAPKPTKASKPKAPATKAPTAKTVDTKLKVSFQSTAPNKVAPTSANVRPTPPRPTKYKLDNNVKSLHKPFPPFDKTERSGTAVPTKRFSSGYQQVQQEGSRLGRCVQTRMSHLSHLVASSFHHPG